MPTVLIFGDLRDPHVEAVKSVIESRGGNVFVFSRYDPSCHITLSVIGGRPRLAFLFGEERISAEAIQSVWWRQKPFRSLHPTDPERNAANEFAGREWAALLNSLPVFLQSSDWMNTPDKQQQANSKPNQLIWAAASGFLHPSTVFTNNLPDVEALVRFGKSVYKTLSGYIFPDSQAIFTTIIGSEMLKDALYSVGVAPGIYQHYVDKMFEARIYFIDDTLISVKIDSQSCDITSVDWRKDQETNIYETYALGSDVEKSVRMFSRLSGLRFGAIDGIIADDGKFYFLECNPAGQWLWLEHFTGAPITSAVAESLCSRRRQIGCIA